MKAYKGFDKDLKCRGFQYEVGKAWGYESKAKGAIGSYIVLSEFSDVGDLLTAKMAKVDGEIIKADTFYTLEGGEFVEVVDDE